MNRRFEDLWDRAADDGASCPVGVSTGASGAELDQLLDAWYRERTQRIEGSLVLDQAQQLLARLVAEEGLNPRRRRQAGRVLRAIRGLQGDGP
jgi:hypothetical protein